jgi:putative transposase
MKNAHFETDLSDAQWDLIQPHLPAPKPRGRLRTPLFEVVNAILYITKAGSHWRLLPKSFPPWKTVYHQFRRWSLDNTLSAIMDVLRGLVRPDLGRNVQPTAPILDSQSVKSDPHGGPVGYDAAKKIKGRKRFLLVDSLGLVLGAAVVPADTTERDGAMTLLDPLVGTFKRLRKLWVDGGFSGDTFADWVMERRPALQVEVVKRTDDLGVLKVLPKRWVVERTFGWLMRNRRLVPDHEETESSATAFIHLALIRLLLRRLA